jgi:hypothetical protein
MDRVPHGDAVKDTDTVPLELAAADGDDNDELDGLTVPLFSLDTDELYDADTVGDAENDDEIVGEEDNVGEIVEDVESVPDPDCDMDRVLQGDDVYDTDAVPHELADADEQMVSEPDGLTVLLLMVVTDEL